MMQVTHAGLPTVRVFGWGLGRGWVAGLLCAAWVMLALGCSGESAESGGAGTGGGADSDFGGRPVVAVSIPPQAWLVERLAGDRVAVVTLLKPGDNPHTYAPSDAEVTRVMRAAVFLRIGVGFENAPWFRSLLNARRGPRVIDQRAGITLRDIEAHHAEEAGHADGYVHVEDHGDGDGHAHDHTDHHTDHHADDNHDHGDAHDHDHAHHDHAHHDHAHHDHGGQDPHVWLNPSNLRIMAKTAHEALVSIDPAGRADYDARLETLLAELDALDVELRERLEPLRGSVMLIYHPAWGYFCDAYGLRQVAVKLAGRTPTDAELTELRRVAQATGSRTVYHQPQFGGRTVAVIAEAIGGEAKSIDPLASDVAANLRQVAAQLVADHATGAGR